MKSLYILIFLFVASISFGQHTFQREFEVQGRSMFHGGMAVANDGGYFLSNVFLDPLAGAVKVHLTKHHYKGDVLWSYDYVYEDAPASVGLSTDVVATTDKGVIFAITELVPGTVEMTAGVLVKIDENGNLVWSKKLAEVSDEDFSEAGELQLIKNYTEGFLYANQASDNDSMQTNAYLASMSDEEGLVDWSNLYIPLDENGGEISSHLTAISQCFADTSYVISGTTSQDTSNYSFVAKLDRDGQVVWSKRYLQELRTGLQNHVTDIACSSDTTTVLTGYIEDLVNDTVYTYVKKIDLNGDVVWVNLVNLPGDNPVAVTAQVVVDAGDNIIVSGKMSNNNEQSEYIIRLNSLGQLVWSKTFPRLNTFFDDQILGYLLGGDLELNGLEYSLSGTAINPDALSLYPYVIRFDAFGGAVCEENAMASLNDSLLTFQADTLTWTAKSYANLLEVEVSSEEYLNYDLPMVTLLDTFFCPQDPIMVTLDATAQYAETYEWSTGDTTPTIFVEEDGEYMVTVTFDTLACFSLCDTSVISKLEFPSLAMSVSNLAYCTTGGFAVNAGASEGFPPFTYEWSTGEDIQTIAVTEYGNYAVTITDQCGNSEESQIAVTEANLPNPGTPDLDFDQQFFCETGMYKVRILNGGEFTDLLWSTGETGNEIIVPGPGSYSVSGINCFQDVMATIDEGDFAELEEMVVNTETTNAQYCIDQTFPLETATTGGLPPYTYMWSTGDTGSSINVSELGIYTVTVTDNCLNTAVETFDINEGLVPAPAEPTLNIDFNAFCTTGAFPINITNADENFTQIEWSTGQVEQTQIQVEEVGTYSVVALDCFQEVGASISLAESDIPTPMDPILEVQTDSFCTTGNILISITNAGNSFFGVEWNTGAVNTAQIEVEETGTYTVTATNCFQEVSGSIEVGSTTFPEGLKFPNVFMPQDEINTINRSFGPYVECPSIIEDYEFKVFNRWGKMVFESDDVDLRWNGAIDSKRQPSEVFYWYARYTTPAGETVLEGDVTLLR